MIARVVAPSGRRAPINTVSKSKGGLNIWMVTPEMHRIKKTGGLADAVYGLSEGLVKNGHNVTAVMPNHHGSLEFFLEEGFHLSHFTNLKVPHRHKTKTAKIFEASIPQGGGKLNFLFIDSGKLTKFGNRKVPYGYNDDPFRFLFFNRTVYQLFKVLAPGATTKDGTEITPPQIIHGHDWQSGYTPFFLRQHPNLASIPFIYNIHNLGYGPGLSLEEFSRLTSLPLLDNPKLYSWNNGIEFYGHVDAHKVAIMYSDKIITVSPQYAQEIISGATPFPANQYQGILNTRKGDVLGILNGLPDYFGPDYYAKHSGDEEENPFLPATFSATDMCGRTKCREQLQAEFDLPINKDVMIVTWTSRIAQQKGIGVTVRSIIQLLKELPKLQLIFIADGEKDWERALAKLSKQFPKQVKHRKFSERDEILALAGTDVLLMPSLYEPCGLNQMKAQKLGSVPLVHETGGLMDTVKYGKTGFSFWGLTQENLINKMKDVWTVFQNKDAWEKIVDRIMQLDYSWTTKAGEYEEIYYQALKKQR